MKNQYIQFWEFEPLIKQTIPNVLIKYNLKIEGAKNNEIVLKNTFVSIIITDRFGDFSIGIENKNKTIITLNELIFKKYPNYIELVRANSDKMIFRLKSIDFDDYKEYFKYLIFTSFEFLEINFKDILTGDFSIIDKN